MVAWIAALHGIVFPYFTRLGAFSKLKLKFSHPSQPERHFAQNFSLVPLNSSQTLHQIANGFLGSACSMALSPLSTSNAGKFHDFVPHIPAAGKVLTDPLDNVSRCMKFDTDNMPSTPPGIKPFRKSTQHEAGKVLVHYGKARDVGPPDMRFGHINNYSDTAKGLMGSKEPSPFVEHLRNLKESTKPLYRSEPLGKSANKYRYPVSTTAVHCSLLTPSSPGEAGMHSAKKLDAPNALATLNNCLPNRVQEPPFTPLAFEGSLTLVRRKFAHVLNIASGVSPSPVQFLRTRTL